MSQRQTKSPCIHRGQSLPVPTRRQTRLSLLSFPCLPKQNGRDCSLPLGEGIPPRAGDSSLAAFVNANYSKIVSANARGSAPILTLSECQPKDQFRRASERLYYKQTASIRKRPAGTISRPATGRLSRRTDGATINNQPRRTPPLQPHYWGLSLGCPNNSSPEQ